MKHTLFHRITQIGFSEELPIFLQRKVQTTNVITLILLFVIALPFVGISLIFFPPLALYPALGAMVCMGVLIINYYGGIYFSRVIVSLMPVTLGAIYNAYLSDANDPPIPSIYLIELSFALIPFVIFDLREKGFLSVITLYCATIVITFPITKMWFHSDADSTILREGWLATVSIGLAIMTEIGCVYGLALLNKNSETRSEILLQEMDQKNAVLQNSSEELQGNLKKLEEAQLAEMKRSWATEGIAKVSELLRANYNSQELYDKVISMIVNYVKANQAGLYIVNEKNETNKDTTIKLVACYAYSRKKYLSQEHNPGEGLLGQAYLEKEYILMTQVPDNYIRISSGLGDARPKCLLIMPMKINDVVEGLLEIASFREFEAHEIDFFKRLGETLASAIQHQRINEHTKHLLKNTLDQSETLQLQEEAMRNNLEELSSIQEEIHRKEMEYIKRIQELELIVTMNNMNTTEVAVEAIKSQSMG